MVGPIYPPELGLKKAKASATNAPFLDLHLFILSGFVSSKMYDKRDDFGVDIAIFSFFFGLECSSFYLLRCLHFSTYSIC